MGKKRDVVRPTEARATKAIDAWAKTQADAVVPGTDDGVIIPRANPWKLDLPKTQRELILEEIAQLRAELESLE